MQAFLERDGIRVVCLDLPRPSILRGPSFVVYLIRVLRALFAVVRRHRVAIIHAHLPDCIIMGALVGALTRTGVVATYHGLGIFPPGRRPFDPRSHLRRFMYCLSEKLTDRTIAVSQPVRDLLCRQLGFAQETTVLILNGVDTETLAQPREPPQLRSELGLAASDRVITCVGRLVTDKGQRFLVEAMSEVVRHYPSAILVLLGDGPSGEELKTLTRELQLESYVRFAGERTDVPAILAMTEIFVLPSLAEGIPLAVIEAMAAGKPVVATAVPGNVDVIEDDRFGRLVPSKDAGALARAICALLAEPIQAEEMARRAQARVRERFNIKRTLAATEHLYDQVMTERA